MKAGHNKPPRQKAFKRLWVQAIEAHPKKPTGAIAVGDCLPAIIKKAAKAYGGRK